MSILDTELQQMNCFINADKVAPKILKYPENWKASELSTKKPYTALTCSTAAEQHLKRNPLLLENNKKKPTALKHGYKKCTKQHGAQTLF